MSVSESTTELPRIDGPPAKTPKKRRRGGLSIQSKLLIMLLSVSLISSVIVGIIGYVNGRESLREAAIDQLTTIRELRVGELESAMKGIQDGVALDSRNLSAQTASRAINAGWDDLQNRQLSPDEEAKLEAYYTDTFNPQLEARTGNAYSPTAFIPSSNAGRWAQYHFTTQFSDFDQALAVNDGNDGTPYSAATEQYGDYLTRLVQQVGYEDLLLFNLQGDVVYSAYKGIDLGTNVVDGPFRDSALGKAYQEAIATNSTSTVITTDFERYIPSLNAPALWVLSPVGNDTAITGVLAAQIPISKINDVMTGKNRWKEQGLGDTGEVYLVGPDHLMRSISRGLVEDPEDYAQRAIANGTPPDVAKRIVEVNGTVLLQPVNTVSVENALKGETGTSISTGYLGNENITAYSPIDVDGLNWVAVARIDTAEAFAPVVDFTRTLLLSLLAIMLVVSLLSLVLAQVFTRPIKKLVDAVRRVAGGDLAVQVPSGSRDEIGDLGLAFNDMASSLRIKQDLIDEQQIENQKLMHTLMPEAVADRYRSGEETISEEHDNVSVVFAELVGFDEHARDLNGEEETVQLNALMRGFDEAATRAGVEKVRALRGGYLASSGLIIPRVDNVRRAVDFAKEMRGVVERFNAQHGADIDLRAGVDTGTVTSGLVARTSLAYDLWGDAVSLAYRVRSVTGEPGIYVSESVRDRLQDSTVFTQAGTVELQGKTQTVWRVQ
ncbi:adenylate/guanylate cyclase domain-containing protein [Microbacterium rhizomatis]|uniref:HAMP domain-containing protein n=1 Tax=Microbacterium rhizomatis TaxID=1631477 RepID=A0A5J5J5U3_9MICO|nr:adenylate/guanylate cyclase domain-containing protein [Microbacterium rhizomatis]KAA9111391.1 HAMP domain-containing protein [Microbacterium rhizomatis]